VIAIANLADLLQFLEKTNDTVLKEHLPKVQSYRHQYGIN